MTKSVVRALFLRVSCNLRAFLKVGKANSFFFTCQEKKVVEKIEKKVPSRPILTHPAAGLDELKWGDWELFFQFFQQLFFFKIFLPNKIKLFKTKKIAATRWTGNKFFLGWLNIISKISTGEQFFCRGLCMSWLLRSSFVLSKKLSHETPGCLPRS